MEHWSSVSTDNGMAIDTTLVCRLLNAIGSVDHTTLANAILDMVHSHVPMTDCTVIGFAPERAPRIVSAASLTDDRQIFHCVSNYARHLFQQDRIQLHLQSILPQQDIGHITVHRQTLTQIVDAEVRRFYEETLEIVDHMAITITTGRRGWITTYLCRHRNLGPFDKDEIETIRRLASLIATGVSQHCRLEGGCEGDSHLPVSDGMDELCSQLTQRERQVILRILDGVTVEQIAGELGLKPTTVITYRSRAYEKLGIRSRRELFSTVLRKRNGANHQHAAISHHPQRFNRPAYATGTGTDRPHQ